MEELIELENRISKLNKESSHSKEELEDLLYERQRILNKAFIINEKNLERLSKVNEYLRTLTIKLFNRVEEFSNKLDLLNDNSDFSDYELEGTLTFSYNDKDSILEFDDDDQYGSDFHSMINIIDDVDSQNLCFTIYQHTLYDNESRDFYINSDCKEYPWWDIPLHIYYATHWFCSHSLYSLPDLIRLNDFWVEVNYVSQYISKHS